MTATKDGQAVRIEQLQVELPSIKILQGINWEIPRGARAVVLGPNGCGKSTLLRVITGYGHFTSGRVTVLGETLGQTHLQELRRQLGVVDPRLSRLVEPRISAVQLVATGFFASLTHFYDVPTLAQHESARRALAEVGLGSRAEQEFTTLSSGQQTRVWLARALVHHPQLLILDEPTAELDLLARETFLATLAKLLAARPQLTLILVTHHLEDLLPTTSHVLLLREGRAVAQGPPAEVLCAETLSSTFGCPVEVQCRQQRWSWSVAPQVWSALVDEAEHPG